MAAAAPYIIAAIGTYASMKSQQDAADERRQILNTQLESSDAASKKTNALVLENAQNNYDPTQRQANLDAKTNEISDQQQKDLQAGAGGGSTAPMTAGDAGNVSDDFLQAKADKAVTEGTRLTSLAKQIAKSRAVGGLLQDENKANTDLGANLQDISSANRNSYSAAMTDAGSVSPSSLGALGSLAGSIGSAAAANGAFDGLFSGGNQAGGLTSANAVADSSGYGFAANPKNTGQIISWGSSPGFKASSGINFGGGKY